MDTFLEVADLYADCTVHIALPAAIVSLWNDADPLERDKPEALEVERGTGHQSFVEQETSIGKRKTFDVQRMFGGLFEELKGNIIKMYRDSGLSLDEARECRLRSAQGGSGARRRSRLHRRPRGVQASRHAEHRKESEKARAG